MSKELRSACHGWYPENGQLNVGHQKTGYSHEKGHVTTNKFEIDNKVDIIPGSFIEIFLITTEVKDALIIPLSALLEEQGHYYAYVQTSGEGFQKRNLKLGSNDGEYVQVLSGIKENERVVSKGAYQIKLATMSGKMPSHGHEH